METIELYFEADESNLVNLIKDFIEVDVNVNWREEKLTDKFSREYLVVSLSDLEAAQRIAAIRDDRRYFNYFFGEVRS